MDSFCVLKICHWEALQILSQTCFYNYKLLLIKKKNNSSSGHSIQQESRVIILTSLLAYPFSSAPFTPLTQIGWRENQHVTGKEQVLMKSVSDPLDKGFFCTFSKCIFPLLAGLGKSRDLDSEVITYLKPSMVSSMDTQILMGGHTESYILANLKKT